MCDVLTPGCNASQVLSLPAVVAPTKVLIVPLSAKAEFDPLVREVCEYTLVRVMCSYAHPSLRRMTLRR